MNTFLLSTERLTLRPVAATDLEAVHHILSEPLVDRYNTLGVPASLDDTRAHLDYMVSGNQATPCERYSFAIIGEQYMGLIAINLGVPKYRRAEVWYKLLPDHWGEGYATEALRAIVDLGFDTLGLHRIEAGCAVENIGSIRVLEKVGMQREGRKRKSLPLETGWEDGYEYGMLVEDRARFPS